MCAARASQPAGSPADRRLISCASSTSVVSADCFTSASLSTSTAPASAVHLQRGFGGGRLVPLFALATARAASSAELKWPRPSVFCVRQSCHSALKPRPSGTSRRTPWKPAKALSFDVARMSPSASACRHAFNFDVCSIFARRSGPPASWSARAAASIASSAGAHALSIAWAAGGREGAEVTGRCEGADDLRPVVVVIELRLELAGRQEDDVQMARCVAFAP